MPPLAAARARSRSSPPPDGAAADPDSGVPANMAARSPTMPGRMPSRLDADWPPRALRGAPASPSTSPGTGDAAGVDWFAVTGGDAAGPGWLRAGTWAGLGLPTASPRVWEAFEISRAGGTTASGGDAACRGEDSTPFPVAGRALTASSCTARAWRLALVTCWRDESRAAVWAVASACTLRMWSSARDTAACARALLAARAWACACAASRRCCCHTSSAAARASRAC